MSANAELTPARAALNGAVKGTYSRHDTQTHVRLEAGDPKAIWWRSLNLLRAMGFEIGVPADVLKHYRSLAPTSRYGIRKGLEFESRVDVRERGCGTFEFEFFQNVVFENRNGGRYDFGKLQKMPYLIRLRFEWAQRELEKLWRSFGIQREHKPDWRTAPAMDLVRWRNQTNGHFRGDDPLAWEPKFPEFNAKGGDGKRLRPGEVKYFYRCGRLVRGQIFYSLNNQWWVVLNEREVTTASAGDLLDFKPGRPRRWTPPRERRRRIEAEKAKALREENYERAIVLRDLLKREGGVLA